MGASAERTDGKISRGSVIAGRYRLETLLARGGMGSVWIARHVQLDTLVAVKFMDSSYAASSEARSRFEREAKAAALLKSPHVVTVHDYGVEENQPFLVMELLQGEDLGGRLKREKRLSLSSSISIVGQVAKALRKAHEAGIVHRDMKPRNVFLARHDDEEVVKVLDFGVAKIAGLGKIGDGTQTGMLIGSPHYMSPEQARRAREVDARSDLWSLAVIAFRCITGELPFPGDEVGDVIVKICTEPAPSVRELDPKLPSSLDGFFKKALAKSAKDRFQTARELATALIAALGERDSYPPGAPAMSPAPGVIDSGAFAAIDGPAAQSHPSGVQAAQSHPSMNQPAADSHPSALQAAARSHPSMNQPAAQSHPSMNQPAAQSHPSMNQPAAQSFSGIIVAQHPQDALETKRPAPLPVSSSPALAVPSPRLDPPSVAATSVAIAPAPPPAQTTKAVSATPSSRRGLLIGLGVGAAVVAVVAIAAFSRGGSPAPQADTSPSVGGTPAPAPERPAPASRGEPASPAPSASEDAPPSVRITDAPFTVAPGGSAPPGGGHRSPAGASSQTAPSKNRNPILGI